MLTLLFWFSVACGQDFKNTAPPQWQEVKPSIGFQEFRNTKSLMVERVLLFAQKGNETRLEKGPLEKARESLFESVGYSGYNVLSIEPRGDCLEIRSTYKSLQQVQVLERRCVIGDKQFHVFYLREDVALNEISRARAVIANFQPIISRKPASEIASGEEDPRPVKLLSDEASRKQFCERIPVARRRDFDASPAQDAKTLLDVTVISQHHCLRGAILDNVWDLLKSSAEYNWALVKYRFNPNYRQEVNAAVSIVASEVRKDPSAYAAKVGEQIAKATRDSGIEYMSCLKASEQIRVFCKIAAGLIPGGFLAKLGSKVPLAAEEATLVAKVVREALELEKPRLLKLTDDKYLVLPPKKAAELPNVKIVEEGGNQYVQSPNGTVQELAEAAPRASAPVNYPEIPAANPLIPAMRDIEKVAVTRYSQTINKYAPLTDYTNSTKDWREWNGIDLDKLPAQGWKLHVNAETESAAAIAEVMLPELRHLKIPHKVIHDLERFRTRDLNNTQAGKFITIYPRSQEEAAAIAKLLAEILRKRGLRSGDFIKPPTEHQFYPGVTGRYGILRFQNTPVKHIRFESEWLVENGEAVKRVKRIEEDRYDWIKLPDGKIIFDNRDIPYPKGFEP